VHRHAGLCSIIVATAVVTACGRTSAGGRPMAVVSDSSQTAGLAIREFRRLSHDSGAVVVISFLRAGDSVVIHLAPGGVPGEVTWRPGGRFVVRRGTVVAASLIQ